mmetsp:Transcript_4426/g.7869  ORF Transcript_4426/g.7869 Transcript_4426/m.7869 type:complete len:214 (-) Transcript_4426:222-863(-)
MQGIHPPQPEDLLGTHRQSWDRHPLQTRGTPLQSPLRALDSLLGTRRAGSHHQEGTHQHNLVGFHHQTVPLHHPVGNLDLPLQELRHTLLETPARQIRTHLAGTRLPRRPPRSPPQRAPRHPRADPPQDPQTRLLAANPLRPLVEACGVAPSPGARAADAWQSAPLGVQRVADLFSWTRSRWRHSLALAAALSEVPGHGLQGPFGRASRLGTC